MDITFSESVHRKANFLKIDLANPITNLFQINGVDYIPYYLDNKKPGNKGGNAFILKLLKAQDYDEDNEYPDQPDLIIKICRTWIDRFGEKPKSQRFKREIDAIIDCSSYKMPNVLGINHFGKVKLFDDKGHQSLHWYYTMDYAQNDLTSFLQINNLELSDRVELCLEIADSLTHLWKKGYYHRDIKPDNILFIDGYWVISDLGLTVHRDEDVNLEIESFGDWVGPRGWMSPESMNKFLCEGRPWDKLHDHEIDHGSDIFQLGKVMWYILQGNAPIGSLRRNDFLWKNENLYQIIRRMLNHSKLRRYSDIKELTLDLKRVHSKLIKNGLSEVLY